MKNKISYSLRKLSEKEYQDAPEEVRKVYIHVLKKVPMDPREKARILAAYPAYFTRKKPVSFSQRVRNIESKKGRRRDIKTDRFESYVKNCLTILTKKDQTTGEPIFFENEKGQVMARLDGYAIVPGAEYERLRALDKSGDNRYKLEA